MANPTGNVEAKIVSVGYLFSGAAFWEIPPYQRPYCWTPIQVTRLLEDIWSYFLHPSAGGAAQFKMLGEMVSANDISAQGPLRHEVVDGQQRLITLALAIRALAYLAKQEELSINAAVVDSDSESCNEKEKEKKIEEHRLAAREIERNTKPLYKTDGDGDERVALISPYDPELREWFRSTFLQEDHTVLSNAFKSEEYPSKDSLVRGRYLESCRHAHRFLKSKMGGSKGGLPRLAAFLKFMTQHTLINHTTTRDRNRAFDIFDALNGTGLPLTDIQKLKAHLLSDFDYSNQDMAIEWSTAEEKLGRMQWGHHSRLDADANGSEPLKPFLNTLAEIMAAAENAGYGKATTATTKAPWEQNLKRYFMESFTILCQNGKQSVRLRLFDEHMKPNMTAIRSLFTTHFSNAAIDTFCSLVHIADDCSALSKACDLLDYAYVDHAQSRVSVQNHVALLRLLGHHGLDSGWISPAYAFVHRHFLSRTNGSGHECRAEDLSTFFFSLERLAAYMLFAAPRERRNKFEARAAAFSDLDLEGPEDEQLEYVHRVQMVFYRELLVKIGQKSIEEVLAWMSLSDSEKALFSKRFPVTFPTHAMNKRAMYALMKAEICSEGSSTAVGIQQQLIEHLPKRLQVNAGHKNSVRRDLAKPLQYHQLVLKRIAPAQKSTLRSAESSNWLQWTDEARNELKDWLGNLALIVPDDKGEHLSHLEWEEIRTSFEPEPLKHTREISKKQTFVPLTCKLRDKKLRNLLGNGWGISLQKPDLPAGSNCTDVGSTSSPAPMSMRPNPRALEIGRFIDECGGWAHLSEVKWWFRTTRNLVEQNFHIDRDSWVSRRRICEQNERGKRKAADVKPRGSVAVAHHDEQIKRLKRQQRFGI